MERTRCLRGGPAALSRRARNFGGCRRCAGTPKAGGRDTPLPACQVLAIWLESTARAVQSTSCRASQLGLGAERSHERLVYGTPLPASTSGFRAKRTGLAGRSNL